MKKVQKIFGIAVLILSLFACNANTIHAGVTAVIDGTTSTSPTSYSFAGTVTGAQGLVMPVKYGTSATALTTSAGSVNELANGTFNGNITGLLPNTDYWFMVYDANNTPLLSTPYGLSNGNGNGNSGNPQVILNSTGTVLTTTAFTFTGDVYDAQNLVMHIKYGTTPTALTTTGETVTEGSDGSFTGHITGLTPNTYYYFELLDSAGTPLIELQTFQTPLVDDGNGGGSGIDLNGAQQQTPDACQGTNDYCLLAPLPGLPKITPSTGFGDYLNFLIKFTIGFAGVLAVVMLVVGGIEYMGSESFTKKEEAKSRIGHAIGGLLLALAAFLILNTINPNLVHFRLGIKNQSIDVIGEVDGPLAQGSSAFVPTNVNCPGSGGKPAIPAIAASFQGNTTYSMILPKGTAGPSGTVLLDCSGYVEKVLSCAGLPPVPLPYGGGTGAIFSAAEKITSPAALTGTQANGIEMQNGDLLGWKAGESGFPDGHVLIYVGGGYVMESHGPANAVGQSVSKELLDSYPHKSAILYIKRN